jgi:hypothetical protein
MSNIRAWTRTDALPLRQPRAIHFCDTSIATKPALRPLDDDKCGGETLTLRRHDPGFVAVGKASK